MPKYQIELIEITKRSTTIFVDAVDYESAFKKSTTTEYGENDFGVISTDVFPVNITECVEIKDIPDDIDVFMANVLDAVNGLLSGYKTAVCKGVDFIGVTETPLWTISFQMPSTSDVYEFVECGYAHITFSDDWRYINSVRIGTAVDCDYLTINRMDFEVNAQSFKAMANIIVL